LHNLRPAPSIAFFIFLKKGTRRASEHRKAFEEMNKAFDQYNIKPVIDTVYTFEQAQEAFQHLAKGAFGKIVIKI
jgi:NADPH:quinone reductase-like Zn-dependent oxidoreductase